MNEPVLFQIEGAVATVIINRPDQRNALDAAAKAGLLEHQHRLGLTSDHRDAVTAFLRKQRPTFSGS